MNRLRTNHNLSPAHLFKIDFLCEEIGDTNHISLVVNNITQGTNVLLEIILKEGFQLLVSLQTIMDNLNTNVFY